MAVECWALIDYCYGSVSTTGSMKNILKYTLNPNDPPQAQNPIRLEGLISRNLIVATLMEPFREPCPHG